MADKVPTSIDLNEVAKLVAALERDLASVKSGSQDVQALRNEVDALKNILDSSAPDDHHVSHRLQKIHTIFDDAVDSVVDDAKKAASYAAQIGRMLGL